MATSTYQTVVDIAQFITGYAVTLAAVGALTMALIETYKKLFSTLGRFHRTALLQWLGQVDAAAGRTTAYAVEGSAQSSRDGDRWPYEWQRAFDELLHLTAGLSPQAGNATRRGAQGGGKFERHVSAALFELDLARMMGQIQEAADAALNNPSLYPGLFVFLTRGCGPGDVELWRANLADARARELDPGAPSPQTRALADIYGRLRLLVRRQLDCFQTVTAYRWRELNQLWAIVLGAGLLLLAQLLQVTTTLGVDELWTQWPKILISSLLGGMLAPVAKDLVDGLSRVKSGG